MRGKIELMKIPHIVILGAGASKAAFPEGDKNSKKLPLMNNFVDVLNLKELFGQYSFSSENGNFEEIFSEIISDPTKSELKEKVEDKIYNYFSAMEIPHKITIYDKLILSLRDKDIIATFNWDPFLFYAYRRCSNYFKKNSIKLPQIVFLHGNVMLGVCSEHNILGAKDCKCSKCAKMFEKVPLLYPVVNKGYMNNAVIKDQWDQMRNNLKESYFVTIFGYGAPDADKEAISLMHDIWEKNVRRYLAEFEIIDIDNEENLQKRWRKFFVRDHFRIKKNIFESYLFKHPRRSIEAFFNTVMQNNPISEQPFIEENTFEEIEDWLVSLLIEE